MTGRLRERWERILGFLRGRRPDQDLEAEVATHIDMAVEENLKRGMSLTEARWAAAVKFGSRGSAQEGVGDQRGLPKLEDFLRDVNYAWRGMRKSPVFTSIVVLTLALGIGANTALFSLVHAVLIQPMPYPDSERLVRVWSSVRDDPRESPSLPDYRDWKARSRSFDEMGAYDYLTYNLTGGDHPEALLANRVTASLWAALQIRPLIGRLFDSRDEQWGQHRVVLLSEGLWRRRFGSDPSVLGRSLQLNEQPFTVVGVMPAVSQFPGPDTDLWAPMSFPPGSNADSRDNYFSTVIARLKPSFSLAQARQELSAVAAQLAREIPQNEGRSVVIEGLRETLIGDIRPTVLLLFGSAGLVLLIACSNVASLLLARASARRRELTVRVTLGAGRARLLRQLLTESMALSGAAALLGLGIAHVLMRLLLYLAPPGTPRIQDVSLNATVLGFTLGIALLTALCFGLLPAWHAARIDMGEGLKDSGRGAVTSRFGGRPRKVLVVGQVALSLVLLIGANLLIVSLMRLQEVQPGFAPDRLLTLQVNLPMLRYKQPQSRLFVREAVEKLAALPGIQAAAATSSLPLTGSDSGNYFTIDGRPIAASMSDVPIVNFRQITPGYIHAMGATLLRGRLFTDQDLSTTQRVAIVNESNARRFWPNEDPIGKRIWLMPPESLLANPLPVPYASLAFEVVGIVADLRTYGLETPPNPEVFLPLAQAGFGTSNSFWLVARTATEPMEHAKAVEVAIHSIDKDLAVTGLRSMEARLANSFVQRRFSIFLLGLFAALALILAMVGLYGVIAYTVTQRTQEMGIRAALGARAPDLLRLVVGQGLVLAAIGVVLGLVSSVSLSSFIRSHLFQVEAVDPLLYGTAAALMLVLAALACYAPGRRAARTDPAITLRSN